MKTRTPPVELADRVASYPEPDMRRVALGAWLARATPPSAAAWLAEILRRGREGGPPFDVTLAALLDLLERPDPLGYDALSDIYLAARENGLEDLARLFLSCADGGGGGEARGRVMEAADGRPLTLGERKTLARRSTRDQIARLLRDPEPAVLRQLLLNPKLTERDVVLLAARRPTTAKAQEIIATAPRFASHHAVRRALVLNPHTPARLAIRFCALLMRTDLALVAAEPSLPTRVREAASLLLAGRRSPTSRP